MVSFGVRHLPAGGNRMLEGRIERAQLYDQALSDAEIAATFTGAGFVVTDADVLAALSDQDRGRVQSAKQEIAVLQTQIDALGSVTSESAEVETWTDLVQAMLTLKEFIYVR